MITRFVRFTRYSLRTLLFIVLVLSAWLAFVVNRAADQSRAVQTLTNVHARVMYDYHESSPGKFDPLRSSNLPNWLSDATGINLLHTAVWVDLDSPAVTDETLKTLRLLPRLRVLHISNTSITDAGLTDLTHLQELEWLTLNTAGLSDSALVHVGKLQTLRRLEVYDAPISDAGLQQLHGLRQLESLVVDQTDVTSHGIADLNKALPGCRIDW